MLGASSWQMLMAIPVLLGTIARLEQDQRRLAQSGLISHWLASPRSPPALPAQEALMATMSAYRSASDAKDLPTPTQAPQAANAWV